MHPTDKHKILAIMALALFLVTSSSMSAPMPEFGDSVQFDYSGVKIELSRLRGKAVLILFVQSWCGICNNWAPKLIEQVQDAHGDNRSLVLMAIKTDGGGVSGARTYFKSRGADLDKWCIGSDKNAVFYKKVTGSNDLWGYILVDANGEIAEQGKAGAFWSSGPNKGKCVLSSDELLKNCGKIESVLPPGKEYHDKLTKIVQLAELGCLNKALSMCASLTKKSKSREMAKDLRRDIRKIVKARIVDRVNIVKNTDNDGPVRYSAYQELTKLAEDFRSLSTARKAKQFLSQIRSDPVIEKERKAETAYMRVMKKTKRASRRDRPRLLREWKMLADRYRGTKYGNLAAEKCKTDKE